MQKITHKKDTFALIYLTVLSVVALMYGFTIIPSAATLQKIVADHKRVIDIGEIQSSIDNYYQTNGQLPKSLNTLNSNAYDPSTPLILTDPQTQQQYTYTQSSPTDYNLCATFSTASSNDDPGAYDDANGDYVNLIGQFSHPAGYYCFDEQEDNTNGDTSNAVPTTVPVPGPQAVTLSSFVKNGPCDWTATFSLTGFSPYQPITVDSVGSLSDNCDASKTHSYSWSAPWTFETDAKGDVTIPYAQKDYGYYNYSFTDNDGHSASVSFNYGPNDTQATTNEPTPTPAPGSGNSGGSAM